MSIKSGEAHTVASVNVRESAKGSGFPNPYWLQERAIQMHTDDLPAYEREEFSGHSYTVYQALTMLVRRLCRATVAAHWPTASRLLRCDYNPDEPADWFLWATGRGLTEFADPPQPVSWSNWRARARVVDVSRLPPLLLAENRWLLPLVLTMPHRLNEAACDYIDTVIGRRAAVL